MNELLERHRRFWHQEPVDRALIGFSGQGVFFLKPFLAFDLQGKSISADQIPHPVNFQPFYDPLFCGEYALGDLMPVLFPPRALPWLEAMLGCIVRMTPEAETMTPVEPENPVILAEVKDSLERNPWLSLMSAFTQWLSQCYGNRFPVGLSLLRGPADMMLALMGSGRFYAGFYDEPEIFYQMARACTDIWIETARQQYMRMASYSGGYGAGVMGLWSPGQVAVFQEDAAGLVSAKIYRDFFLECDQRIANSFPYSILHLHSASLQMLEHVLRIEALTGVNIVLDPQGPELMDVVPAFQKVQRSGKALHIQGYLDQEQLSWLQRQLSPIGLFLYVLVD